MLLPPDLREWLPPDHVCFVINDVVDNLDISCIKATYSDEGSPAYDPRMLLKVVFYCYARGTRSSRKIENMTQENIVCRYLAANQQPDHGTINIFRKDHLIDLENLFAQIVVLCDGLNIIDPSDISIDGTIIKANAAKRKTYNREKIARLKKKIRGILEEAERIDREEDKIYGNKRGYNQMPDKLKDPKTRQKEIKRLQEKMKKLNEADEAIKKKQAQARTSEEKKQTRNNTHNTTDGDANLTKMKKGINYQPAYNVQAATNNQIVAAYGISDNVVDANQLLPMIDKAENNTGKKVKKVKADAAYFSKDNIAGIEEKEIDAYIPDQQKAIEEKQERDNTIPEYDRRNFKYDPNRDEFICPQNKPLPLKEIRKSGMKRYICADCADCSVKSKCLKRGKYRHIKLDSQFEKYKTEMRKKLNSELGKNKYLERMSDVEPVFGNIIYNQSAGHFLCRGRPMVKIEFGLSCTAHNLVKIANWRRKNENKTQFDALMRLPAISIGNQGQTELNFLLVFQCTARTF